MWPTFSGYDLMWPVLSLIFSLAHVVVQCGSQHIFSVKKPVGDGCLDLVGKDVNGYEAVLDCYRSFPFKEKIRSETLETILKTLPFYAFIDISRSSPEPRIPSKTDLYVEVAKMKTKTYKTEMDFQVDLMALFRSLHDGHTSYRSGCFTAFVFRQPFPIITVNDLAAGRGQKFLILEKYEQPSPLLEREWAARGIDVKKYLGAEVLLINAESPLAFIQRYANQYVGSSRDVNSRFNLALARVLQRDGKWGISPGSFAATSTIPKTPHITYTLKLVGGGVETITVPYLATTASKFKDGKDFYDQNCFRSNKRNALSLPKGPKFLEVPEIVHEKPAASLPKPIHAFGEDPLSQPLTKGLTTQTWMVSNKTGAMTIVSFSSNNETQFLGEVENGFQALRKNGARNLILDLSNNGGGVICWGYYVLDYLFPSAFQRRFATDMHETPLLLKLADKDHRDEGFFNFAYWVKENGSQFANITEFVQDHRYLRGGKVSHYTSRFDDKCGANPLQKGGVGQQSPPWDIDHLVVVTNSVCYSTCSLLVNSLQEIHNITTFALGGIRGRPATACSIQGGTVYNLDSFMDDLKELGLTAHPDAPKQLPTSATFSFTIREAYSTKKFNRLGNIQEQSQVVHLKHHHKHHHKKHHKHHKNHTHGKPPHPGLPIEKGLRPLEFTWNEATFHPAYPGKTTFLSPFEQWRQIADVTFPEN